MPGMTMGFDVADKKMLKHVNVGQKVKFQVEGGALTNPAAVAIGGRRPASLRSSSAGA